MSLAKHLLTLIKETQVAGTLPDRGRNPVPFPVADLHFELTQEQKNKAIGKLVDLHLLIATQNTFETERVEELMREPDSGGIYPPYVVRKNGQYYIADGHHRLIAAYFKGKSQAYVLVVNEDITEETLLERERTTKEITVLCNDPDDSLEELIKYIGQNGSGGHSFEIVVDPEDNRGKKFYFDGDGSDSIQDVKTKLANISEAMNLDVDEDDIEKAAENIHQKWVENQKEQGHDSHKSPDGEEEYMVPYDELSEPAKDLDRDAVKAVLDALQEEPTEVKVRIGKRALQKMLKEDGAAGGVAVGNGGIAGIGVNQQGQPSDDKFAQPPARPRKKLQPEESFAGADVFTVNMDKVMGIKGPKHPRHRYSKYIGTDEDAEDIRQHGRTHRKDIILKDKATGVMTYLRRRQK